MIARILRSFAQHLVCGVIELKQHVDLILLPVARAPLTVQSQIPCKCLLERLTPLTWEIARRLPEAKSQFYTTAAL